MEVISTASSNNNHATWGHHRYSSLSLTSAASCESFHTCFESSTEDNHPPPESSLTSRVSSFLCLEDVQEEESIDMSFSAQPLAMQFMVAPLKPHHSRAFDAPITLARLALSSDFGILKRSVQYTTHGHTKSVSNSSQMESLVPPIVLTVQSKSHQRHALASSGIKLEELTDDVQLQILSFVALEDIRVLMSTNRRYRKLLFTRDAQNLWNDWCNVHEWSPLQNKMLVDDLSLPTAARPTSMDGDLSNWHQQANMSLLLSMAQSQPTDIDVVQLNEYHSHHQGTNSRSTRRRRFRHRIHTTDGNQPLLKYEYDPSAEQQVVHFTGRVGQGDRCVRSNKPFPRPTLIDSAQWMVPPSQIGQHGKLSGSKHNHHHAILDLFCRSARAVSPPRPAWRPFVAPFYAPNDATSVHLTPRFVSYYEVSILAGPTEKSSNDCVAVGIATESFDWHSRMPGWDASSFGYHGDDGGIFHSSGGMLRKFGPSYGRGDVVGCGIDHVMRGIFFTLNGEFLGYAWTGLPQEVLERDMYPVVGIDTNDLIHCNFGSEPFKYDLKSLVVRHEELVHQSLSLTQKRLHSSTRSSAEC